MIRLALLQARSLLRSPLAGAGVVGFVPTLWMAPEDTWFGSAMAVGFLQSGFLAQGAAAGTIAYGRSVLPTLPCTPRQRVLATLLTAWSLLLPAFAVACALSVLRGRAEAPLLHAVRLVFVISPFVTLGAVIPNSQRSVSRSMAVLLGAGVMTGILLNVGSTLPGAIVWGLLGTGTLLAMAPQLYARRGDLGDERRAGTQLVAELQGPEAWSSRATTPARAFWRMLPRMPLFWGLLALGVAFMTYRGLQSNYPVTILSLGALMLGGASLFAPIAPAVSSRHASAVLARLPIAPRTVWVQGILAGLATLGVTLLIPTLALVWRASGGAEERWSTGPEVLRNHVVVVVVLACTTVLVRVGWHLRALVTRRAPADVALGAAALGIAALGWLQLSSPLRVIRGEAPPDASLFAFVALLATAAITSWASSTVGVRRA